MFKTLGEIKTASSFHWARDMKGTRRAFSKWMGKATGRLSNMSVLSENHFF